MDVGPGAYAHDGEAHCSLTVLIALAGLEQARFGRGARRTEEYFVTKQSS